MPGGSSSGRSTDAPPSRPNLPFPNHPTARSAAPVPCGASRHCALAMCMSLLRWRAVAHAGDALEFAAKCMPLLQWRAVAHAGDASEFAAKCMPLLQWRAVAHAGDASEFAAKCMPLLQWRAAFAMLEIYQWLKGGSRVDAASGAASIAELRPYRGSINGQEERSVMKDLAILLSCNSRLQCRISIRSSCAGETVRAASRR